MYKIIQNSKVIDVVKYPRFLRFLSTGHVAFTGKSTAQGIAGSDKSTLYSFKPIKHAGVTVASIEPITEEEFNRLSKLLKLGREISADESELAKAKRIRLLQLSADCKNKITEGFTVTLQDGNEYHFRLTAEDQLNLTSLENQYNSGATVFVYHATGAACRAFDRTDMSKILKLFRNHIRYHTTYFNIAKQYINSQVYIGRVTTFTYGEDVSECTVDPIIKSILRNSGGTIE